jgi:hypothetical protein
MTGDRIPMGIETNLATTRVFCATIAKALGSRPERVCNDESA